MSEDRRVKVRPAARWVEHGPQGVKDDVSRSQSLAAAQAYEAEHAMTWTPGAPVEVAGQGKVVLGSVVCVCGWRSDQITERSLPHVREEHRQWVADRAAVQARVQDDVEADPEHRLSVKVDFYQMHQNWRLACSCRWRHNTSSADRAVTAVREHGNKIAYLHGYYAGDVHPADKFAAVVDDVARKMEPGAWRSQYTSEWRPEIVGYEWAGAIAQARREGLSGTQWLSRQVEQATPLIRRATLLEWMDVARRIDALRD